MDVSILNPPLQLMTLDSTEINHLIIHLFRIADSIGGDVFWAAGLSVISDLPFRPWWPVKSHLFINAGRLEAFDRCTSNHITIYAYHSECLLLFTARPNVDTILSTFSKPSIAAGVGLLYKLDPVRVELNFGVPLVASKSDGTRRGFQLGIGLEFL